MPLCVRVAIQGDGISLDELLDEPLEIGRQLDSNEPMLVRLGKESPQRVAIAPVHERNISRRQICIEPVSDEIVRIVNRSEACEIQVDDLRLVSTCVVERRVPVRIQIGPATVKVRFTCVVGGVASASEDVELVRRLQSGDPQIAEGVVERFQRRLIALARTRLSGAMTRHVDPEDVVQSVFRSFFAQQVRGDFSLRSDRDLWSLLTVLTLRKCGHQAEYWFAARRDVRRNMVMDSQEEHSKAFEVLSREPTAVQAAILDDVVQELFRAFPVPERKIIEMRCTGSTTAEISRELEISERQTQRVLQKVREWLESRME